MAATLGTINPDTAHGQFYNNGQILVLPFTDIANGNTYTLSTAMNPHAVAFVSTGDVVAAVMDAGTKVVTFYGAGAGNLLVFQGGESA